jgi:hypothetical protein
MSPYQVGFPCISYLKQQSCGAKGTNIQLQDEQGLETIVQNTDYLITLYCLPETCRE